MSTLVDAVRLAAQDVAAVGPLLDAELVGHDLGQRIQEYWGADHGIGTAELQAIAKDIIAAGSKR